jgi:hypothetical protein
MMVTIMITGIGRVSESTGRLPASGSEGGEIVLVGHCWEPGEDIARIRERVFPEALAGDDDRVNDRGALTGLRVSDKQPVLFPDRGGPDRVFDEVVVETGLMMPEVFGERAQCPSRYVQAFPRPEPGSTFLCNASASLRSQCSGRANIACLSCARFSPTCASSHCAFQAVQAGDQPQDRLCGLRAFGGRFKKLPPRMRPAARPLDAGVRAHIGRVVG